MLKIYRCMPISQLIKDLRLEHSAECVLHSLANAVASVLLTVTTACCIKPR